MTRWRDVIAKQATVRLPEELADQAEAIARVKGTSVNALIVESLAADAGWFPAGMTGAFPPATGIAAFLNGRDPAY